MKLKVMRTRGPSRSRLRGKPTTTTMHTHVPSETRPGDGAEGDAHSRAQQVETEEQAVVEGDARASSKRDEARRWS